MFPSISVPLLLHLILSIGLSLRVLYRRLPVNSALAWIAVLMTMPVAGPVLYVMFGHPTLGQRRLRAGQRIRSYYEKAYALANADRATASSIPAPFDALARSIRHDSGFPLLSRNRYTLLTDTQTILDSMVSDIDRAKTDCCLEFYIIDPQGRVEPILEAVLRAAKRGVNCRILADDFGSKPFFRSSWPDRLKQAGVSITSSLPVGIIKSLSKRSDLRNHRKQLICDRAVAYTGSFNLIDPHVFKSGSHVGEWIDVMMRLEGEMVDALSCVFHADNLLDQPAADLGDEALRALPFDEQRPTLPAGPMLMQLLPSGPEMANSTIYEFIVAAIFNARQRVRIVTPYFIPDQAVLLAIQSAAKRGIAIQLIVPRKLDTRMGQYASQASFDDLLGAGVEILRFSGGLLHTKTMLIDENIALFGTVNMDMRSFYLNLELSLILYEKQAVQDLDAIIDGYASRSKVLDRREWGQRSARQRFLENLFRLASPLL